MTIFTILFCFSLNNVSADMGPKPSIKITFDNMGDELCYGTLLAYDTDSGPYSSLREYDLSQSSWSNVPEDIWKVFVEYKDKDNYNYLQFDACVSKDKELVWGYYPPQKFKLLLYYPAKEKFVESSIYSRYAFDSYFQVDLSNVNLNDKNIQRVDLVKNYDLSQETTSLFIRIVLTILVEVIIALLFGYYHKEQILFISLVNIITQILLNVALFFVNYKEGSLAFLFMYVLLEFFVFVVEAILYVTLINRFSENKQSRMKAILYAFVANGVSFAVGLALAIAIPGIF